MVGLAGDGMAYVSLDRGRAWQPLSGVNGDSQALEVTSDGWFVATSLGVYQSTDEGRTWTLMTSDP